MNKTLLISLIATLACGISQVTWADQSEGQSTMKVEDAKDQKNKLQGDDPDNVLTNAKLRAETGSKSRWSVASSLAFNGGSVSRPFADYRPNIADVNGQSPVSDIEGGINVKYGINQMDSLLLGETVRMVTPLSGTTSRPDGYRGQKMDNYNPSLNYQHIYKAGPFQSYYQVGPTIYTQTDYTSIGYLGNFGIYNVNAYDIGQTRFTAGVESTAGYNWFRTPRPYTIDGVNYSADDIRAMSSDYVLGAYPYLEYRINDTFNLRTVGLWFQIEHTLAQSPSMNTWHVDKALQSVGVGISITRDIFLYPNVQFVPDQLRGKQTNVALSSNINLF